MKYFNHIYFVTFLYVCCCFPLSANIVRRAAFHFASGKIHMQVADVDTNARHILMTVSTHEISIPVSDNLIHHAHNILNDESQKELIQIVTYLKEVAIGLEATEFRGIATEGFLKIKNVRPLIHKFFSKLSLPIQNVSLEKELEIAFLTLAIDDRLDSSKIVLWNMGETNFQIAFYDKKNKLKFYEAPFGRVNARLKVIKHVQKKNPKIIFSPNPMTRSEWKRAVKYFKNELSIIPKALLQKLKKNDVKLLGVGEHPYEFKIFRTYGLTSINEMVEKRLGKTDAELSEFCLAPLYNISHCALIHSVIHLLENPIVYPTRTSSGLTSALLVTNEFWK